MRLRIALAAVLLPPVVLAVYAFFIEPARLTVREEDIVLPGWQGQPLRIALIADIHAGAPFITERKIRSLVASTNATRPDLVFLLGDFVIEGVVGGRFIPPERSADILRGLQPRYGTFAVLGNHDGWLDRERVQTALTANGIRVLRNEQAVVQAGAKEFVIAGLADVMTDRPDIESLHADAARQTIVLTHNPDVFPKIPPFVTLTIAGHTHGGQVFLPLIGRPIVPSRYGERYAAGHVVEEGRHLFVTTGVGTSIIPVRFRVVPEVVVLRVRAR
jgi:predicted MPP superfamily phosphohydrolase